MQHPLLRDRLVAASRRLAGEAGFAVPTAMLATIAAFGLATAVVVASVGAQQGTVRDQDTKAALATAESGIANAMLRYNRISSEGEACAPVGGGSVDSNGWCTGTIEGGVDRGGYTYWVRPTATQLEVVAAGQVNGVVRRVYAVAASAQGGSEGLKPFGSAGVVGLDEIKLNSNATIEADVATNGNIALESNSDIDCGYAQIGIGKKVNPSRGDISCTPVEGEVTLPPANFGDVMTNNSNDRICKVDPLVPADRCPWSWYPSQKKLQLNSNTALTLGASGGEFNYGLCQLEVNSNAYIYIASGARVRLYFGNEDDGCQGWQAESPLRLNSNAKILPTGAGATDLAIIVAGRSPSAGQWARSRIEFNSNATLLNCDQSFALYAPNSEVTLNSNSHICGGLAAKKILVNANASIIASNTASEFELPGTESQYFIGYGPPEFAECTSTLPASGEAPDIGC